MFWLHLISLLLGYSPATFSLSSLLVLYSVWWYLKQHLPSDRADVAAYSIETPIIQKILTYCRDFSFYKTTFSLCLQFKEGLLCVRRCCTLSSLCTEICNFAWMFYWFKFVQIVGEKLWKPNSCKQNNFLLSTVGLGGWAFPALKPGFVGGVSHFPHFQAPGLGKAQALNVLISLVWAGKRLEPLWEAWEGILSFPEPKSNLSKTDFLPTRLLPASTVGILS